MYKSSYAIIYLILITFNIIFTAYCSIVHAAPQIDSIVGNIQEGQVIIINGKDLGYIGPEIVIYDNFERGTNGLEISIIKGSATIGNWDYRRLTVKYSSTYSHSGKYSMHSNWGSDSASEGHRLVGKRLGAAKEIFFSWWQFIPKNSHVPGTSTKYGPNWKLFWIYGPKFPESDYFAGIQTDEFPPPRADYVGFGMQNDRSAPQRYGVGWIYPVELRKGIWKRFDQYLKWGTENDGHFGLWELKSTGYHEWGNIGGITTGHEEEVWDHIEFPGYGRGDSNNSHTYYDDIYVAKGKGARARVEIGNNILYKKCTNLSIMTPTSWKNNMITATVRLGSLEWGSKAYIFVIRDDGSVSRGHPVTIKAVDR